MIYIDTSTFTPNTAWQDKANLLYAELILKPTIEEKKAFIEKNKSFWGEIKGDLPHFDKCWISEAREAVSPYTIEHFRPKNRVSKISIGLLRKIGLKTFIEKKRKDWHSSVKPINSGVGYWWLAFNYKNFRICGTIINSTKGARFPLWQSGSISYEENDDYQLEDHILLDPTKAGDPELLTFDPNGEIHPVIDLKEYELTRVIISIAIYGLNAIPPLIEHRKTKWDDCLELIKDNNHFYPKIEQILKHGGSLSDDLIVPLERFDTKCGILRKSISADSEFSAVAKTCLLSYSETYTWIKDYVFN
jgi:hypothetical protein